MKKILVSLVGILAMATSIFAQNRLSEVEVVTVKNQYARTGLGVPVLSTKDARLSVSGWVLTGNNSTTRYFSQTDVFFGGGVSYAVWQSAQRTTAFKVTGGWSGNFTTLTEYRRSEWALGVSLGTRF